MSNIRNNLPPSPGSVGEQVGPPGETPPSSGTDAWDHLRWWAAAIASLVWVAVYVYFASSRGMSHFDLDFMLVVGWLLASLGLAGLWVVIAVAAVRAWIARNTVRARRLTAFLLPFAVVAVTAIVLGSSHAPLRARFGLSEGSLNRIADGYERTGNDNVSGWAGLYRVEWIRRWENCTVIVTGGFFLDESGFARCSGPPPPVMPWNIKLERLKGDWWTYDSYD